MIRDYAVWQEMRRRWISISWVQSAGAWRMWMWMWMIAVDEDFCSAFEAVAIIDNRIGYAVSLSVF